MILDILKIVASPIKDYFNDRHERKVFDQQIRAEIVKSESERIKYINLQMSRTWKDEILTYWVLGLLTLAMFPSMQPYIKEWVALIISFPEWLQYIIIGTFTAGLGLHGYGVIQRYK